MLNQKFFQKMQVEYNASDHQRREVQKYSGDALHAAKRAIFDLHRGEIVQGKVMLKQAWADLNKADKVYDVKDAEDEGIYRSALEEYAEADLFRQFVEKENIGEVRNLKIATETYLGGLTDLVGEILRYAVKQATARNWKELEYSAKIAEDIMSILVGFNFTGYLRTKNDQAKSSKRKLEEIVYEISLKK